MANASYVESANHTAIAPPPYALPARTMRSGLSHLAVATRVMLTEYRETWWIHLFFGLLMPIGMMFFLKLVYGGAVDPERATFLIGGNLATSIAYGPVMILIQKIGWGRHNRSFDYWSSLPLPKLALVISMVAVALVLAIPNLVGVYLLGSLILGLPLKGGIALLLLVPLGALSLSGFAAFLGAFAKDGPTSNIMSNSVVMVVTFLSPTMVPIDVMPLPLRITSYLMPTTYVADAFRAALSGNFGTAFAYDVMIIALFLGVTMILVHRKLDWRGA